MTTPDEKAVTTPDEQDAIGGLATAPQDATAPEDRRPFRAAKLDGFFAAPRRWWRQLTSMRTALVLLFLLALAAVPGSTFPQRSLNQGNVDEYFLEHPDLAPILDKFDAFDVFAAPWFAAIYLLLFISLVGCLGPRIRVHARAMVKRPPAAPRHLERLPFAAAGTAGKEPAEAAGAVRGVLRRSRWRTVVRTEPSGAVTVSA